MQKVISFSKAGQLLESPIEIDIKLEKELFGTTRKKKRLQILMDSFAKNKVTTTASNIKKFRELFDLYDLKVFEVEIFYQDYSI